MDDELVTRTITLTVTARPQDFDPHAASEDLADDLIELLVQSSAVVLNDVTSLDPVRMIDVRRFAAATLGWLQQDDISGGDMVADLSSLATTLGLLPMLPTV